ncbi:quinol:electron acceptor oxidoreductase subunit ActD [Blastopirellula marina]|uniref:Cytochrome c domain-containing protein n=1 Tax=Blastopirellula marina TaxID=124 RepID=A0A2S8GCH3_9BACT|nr:quinol:electron acceptor oxidoreductase subunit ActD [Blastopirellula marina]PQO42000.1 hypothetical protein C5Y93_26950 [Blastopirellula marina]
MAQDANQSDQKLIGLMAQFDDPDALLAACEKVRKAGYTKTDAYTPFPLHGIDEALGIRPTILPWIVLALGIIGGTAGLALQYFTNAFDYPFLISAKPQFSLPANIPVIFELVILHAAIGVFLGMLVLNRLPTLANPLFRVPEFARATDDKFFLTVDVNDTNYKPNKTRELFDGFRGQTGVLEVFEDPSEGNLPPVLKYIGIAAVVAALVPPLLLWKAYNSTSTQPRINPIRDMDVQLRADTQTTMPQDIFADGRAMRPRIAGTIARGEWIDPVLLTGIVPGSTEQPVAFLQEEQPPMEEAAPMEEAEQPMEDPAEEAAPAAAPAEEPEPNWVKIVPIDVNQSTLKRGQQRYNIYCAVCHGLAGDGDGLVSQRAIETEQATWVPPTNLHSEPVLAQPDGKIFNTITHGIRKMRGYGAQIPPEDRWAIVTYVRALQKTRTGTKQDIPAVEYKALEIKGQ